MKARDVDWFAKIKRWFEDNGMRARLENFEDHEHVVVEGAPFEARPTRLQVTVYEWTDSPSVYHHTWHVNGVGTLGMAARRADRPNHEDESRVKRLVRCLYGRTLALEEGVLFVVIQLPPQASKLCKRLGVEVPAQFDLTALASGVRAAAHSQSAPVSYFMEIAATAIETGNFEMERWCAWANDPNAMIAAEISKMRSIA